MKKLRLLLTNMESYLNLGDRAILLAFVNYLREKYNNRIDLKIQGKFKELEKYNSYDASLLKDIEFVEITAHPFTKYIKKYFDFISITTENKKSSQLITDNFINKMEIHPVFLSLFTLFDLVLIILGLKTKEASFINEIDGVISGGGTQLEEVEYKTFFIPRFIHNLVPLYLSKIVYRKPTYIFGQTVGRIRSITGRLLTRYILNRLDFIYLREKISFDYLKNIFGVDGSKLKVTGDLVFLLYETSVINSYFNKGIEIIKNNKKCLCLCIRNIKERKTEELLIIYQRFLEYTLKNTEFEIILYPQVIDKVNSFHNDYQVCLSLYQKFYGENRIKVLNTSNWSVFDSIQFLNSVDILISMRMHPIIFRLIGKKKKHNFIAISHIHKFEGLLEDLKCTELLINIKELSLELLIGKFNEICNKDINLSERVNFIKMRIANDLDNLILNLLNKEK